MTFGGGNAPLNWFASRSRREIRKHGGGERNCKHWVGGIKAFIELPFCVLLIFSVSCEAGCMEVLNKEENNQMKCITVWCCTLNHFFKGNSSKLNTLDLVR